MKPLILLIIVFILAIAGVRLTTGYYDYYLAGRIAMSAMLVFTSFGHFKFTNGMVMMMPDFLPAKKDLVLFTGFIEIFAAIGLQIPSLITITSWALILFFVLLLPANIMAAIKHVDIEKGTLEGPGTTYLWFRVPLQLFFIAWVYFFGIQSLVP